MERLHRIFSNGDLPLKQFLDRAEIEHKYEESIVGKTVFLLIPETHPKWPELSKFLAERDVFHSVELKHSKQEIGAAEWCSLGTTGHFGYPQPEEYQQINYEPDSVCKQCGIHGEQIAPFRLRKVPTQRHSQLLQLNWVFDAFFVSTAAREEMQAAGITGATFESPVLHTSGVTVPGWFQMEITNTIAPCVVTVELKKEMCKVCRCIKYNHPEGQLLAVDARLPRSTADIVKSSEWFGSGGDAHRLVLVSQRFVKLMHVNRWRGVCLEPIEIP